MLNIWEELTGSELHFHKENTGSKAVFQMCQEDGLHFTGFCVCFKYHKPAMVSISRSRLTVHFFIHMHNFIM